MGEDMEKGRRKGVEKGEEGRGGGRGPREVWGGVEWGGWRCGMGEGMDRGVGWVWGG